MPVHPRHPYAGELVHTAFSGSHQDAISKGLRARERAGQECWEVPYLPIDPADIGRTYEAVIRINSQSGKGGAAWVLEQEHGFTLPKAMHPEFGALVQRLSEAGGGEISPDAVLGAFEREYLGRPQPFELVRWRIEDGPAGDEARASRARVLATVGVGGAPREISGAGNGPIDAFCNALRAAGIADFLAARLPRARPRVGVGIARGRLRPGRGRGRSAALRRRDRHRHRRGVVPGDSRRPQPGLPPARRTRVRQGLKP